MHVMYETYDLHGSRPMLNHPPDATREVATPHRQPRESVVGWAPLATQPGAATGSRRCWAIRIAVVALSLFLITTSPGPLHAQVCWECGFQIDDGQIVNQGCYREPDADAACEQSCSGALCECEATGACGVAAHPSVPSLAADGSIYIGMQTPTAIGYSDGNRRDCHGNIIARNRSTANRDRARAITMAIHL